MVRYYGLYSNAHRGKIHKTGANSSHPPIIEEEDSSAVSRGWAEMIKIDLVVFPVISFFQDISRGN
jgi:hypothetical protein